MTPADKNNAIIHYYRGEIGRMSSWRTRIDQTSNWAITVVAAMLSVSLATPSSHHGVLLFAMLLVQLLLLIESRRYRFFDVYRDRVRLMEKNFFVGIFSQKFEPSEDWSVPLADSLRYPRFSIGRLDAMTRRLRRNYGWMFLILLFAWLLKLSSALLQPEGTEADWRTPFINIVANAQLGPVSGWLVLLGVAGFYALLIWLAARHIDEQDDGEVHV